MLGSLPQRSCGQPPSSPGVRARSRALGIPVKAVERSQAKRHADALERPEIVDVRLQARPPGVLAHCLQGATETRVGGQGRAAGSRRLPFGEAGPRRGDRQPHQARARHRIRSRPCPDDSPIGRRRAATNGNGDRSIRGQSESNPCRPAAQSPRSANWVLELSPRTQTAGTFVQSCAARGA